MKQFGKRAAALGLALVLTAGATLASASDAMGWEVHTGKVGLSLGADLGKNIFWSDSYSDLRTEYYVSYTPNASVTPTVAYGDKVLSRATLTSMAQGLEAQGKRVVSGINGDYYVMATGAPVGMVVSGGVLRSTPAYNDSWAVGFQADGSAFIGAPVLSVTASFQGQTLSVSGGVNKVRTLTEASGRGGLTLLTSDFSSATQNTDAGVDVVLTPVVNDPAAVSASGAPAGALSIGGQLICTVDQVLESTGSIPIPEGKLVLTMNGKDKEEILTQLRALTPGEQVTISVTSPDARWNTVRESLGGMYKMVTGGQVAAGLDAARTARSAIGIKSDGTVVFYAMDGSQAGYSVGATMTQVAQRLVELGCVEAICLDGGGSTTLGATYPGQTGMQVVTSPSGGAQRANSTAIFLTTTLQPTGALSSYYVTPTDTMILAGSSIPLTATGLDTSYYPTASGAVSWSVTSGGGTVDGSGVYTAGTESGFAQVTATDGGASGTAYLTVVKTPDSISLTNEATGGALTALGVDPGEQVDLKATAVYKKLALYAQDTAFTWTADPAVGTVDANGLFTAGATTATGSLSVSAGGKTLTVPVNVAGHVKALETCEGSLTSFASSASATASAETALEYVRYGSRSMKVAYDTSAGGTAGLASTLAIPGGEKYLSVWVYGDGSGNSLLATVADLTGTPTQIVLTALDFTGWKHVSAALPENASAIRSLDIVYGGGEGAQSGTIWLDHFTTSNEEIHDTTPPTVSLQISGSQLTASVQDNVDRSISKESVVIKYDGAPLTFTWNEAAGTGTATLPAADDKYHRVSVTATDNSGNLARASADVEPVTARDPVFADMDDNWAAQYATYLYDAGVVKGVVSEYSGKLLFQPTKNITRAEFFAMAARWMKLDLSQYAGVELPFADASSVPDWALNEVKAMYSLGILKGAMDESGALRVNAMSTISRAEAMTILGRTQARGYAEADVSAFADAAQVPDWALPYIRSLVGQGVVNGNENKITPLNPVTRSEVVKMLYAMQ